MGLSGKAVNSDDVGTHPASHLCQVTAAGP